MARYVSVEPIDVRFPTSRHLDGFDAMNPEPDYSAAYVVVRTDADDLLEWNAFTFTTGRGNDVQTLASSASAPWLIGRDARRRSEAIPRCLPSDGDAARCAPGVRDTRRASGGDH